MSNYNIIKKVKCFRTELENALRLMPFNRGDYLHSHPYEGPIKVNAKKSEEIKLESKSDNQLETKEDDSISKDTLTTTFPNTNILAALEAKGKYKGEPSKEETASSKENENLNKDALVLEESF